MAGIYYHIPFCKQACHYCDFHFSTSTKYKDEMIEAMIREIRIRQDYAGGEEIQTIYFGGGTPSVLHADDIKRLIEEVNVLFPVSGTPEITLEANPDDLDNAKIKDLVQAGVNRLSIGIQSFNDAHLKWMNRAHDASMAESSVKRSQDAGIENITIDLIYGLPDLSLDEWRRELMRVFEMQIPHLSAYCLTIEPGTFFGNALQKGKMKSIADEASSDHFLTMHDMVTEMGFEHYEVSNMAKPGWHSRHNAAYWEGAKYLGIGPSAHSFNGKARQWNLANNPQYIKSLFNGQLNFEKEELTDSIRYNEYVMTRLRTHTGLSLKVCKERFGFDPVKEAEEEINEYIRDGKLKKANDHLLLTREGLLLADRIASDLFHTE